MRNIISILLIGLIYLTSTSCEDMFGDYLDKAPGIDITADTIFSSKAESERFLVAVYEQALQSPWGYDTYRFGRGQQMNNIYNTIAGFVTKSDEAEMGSGWFISQGINNGTTTVTPFLDRLYSHRYTGLRYVHTMFERIDDVPDADQNYKENIKGEMIFLRAQIYFDFFRRYGGMPIVERTYSPVELAETFIPRSSVAEMVDFIVSDCNYAIERLPDSYPSQWKGRITKGAALALKAKTLLYAASPRFNTTTPILSMDDPANNDMLCYGNYDENRWQLAADAAKAVLDWAPSGGVWLIEDKGVDKNYRYAWEVHDNPEIIMADKKAYNPQSYTYWLFKTVGGGDGPMPTQSFVEYAYEKKDGTEQVWEVEATNLDQKYSELDWRFHQTIGYTGFYWNKQRGVLNMALGPAPAGPHGAANKTGYMIKKHISDAVNNSNPSEPKNWIWYRLNEFYLSYAEALNEAQGPVTAAYEAVNRIRSRSGMPGLPAGLTQEQFRERVRKERAVEMAFDGHRWWDILRWQIGREVLNGPFYGLKIYKNQPITTPLTFRYERYAFETRVWQDRFYYYPFSVNSSSGATNEMNKGHLVQNPGW